ncbi:RNA-binding protein 7 isoform X2 [Clupea harengus]|uniref:RNA-binding protein 7 isoform X2 n=1 Tax=Clupea harengus TaxID=7950 RepID=A0A6P8G1T5_CLUHA|nr:RNA-binding protein 7 isoform X2 [Clupea harengus]
MGIMDEADRTLFVGNLDPQVTEELLFELFLQGGPMIKVKIPKDNDGRPKQFAFVNYKHEVSVPYGMSLLNGTKLFGRQLKIQFRSGSSHVNQEGKSPGSTQNPSPLNTPGRPDQMGSPLFATPPQMQRSFSSPDSLQKQALMNNMWQLQMQQLQHLNGAFHMGFQQAYGPGGGGGGGGIIGGGGGVAPGSPWQPESSSQRGHRHSPQQETSGGGGHHGRDQRYSDAGPERHRRDHGQRSDFYHHEDRSGSRTRDYPDRRRDSRDGSRETPREAPRDTPRDGRYRRY